MTVAENHGAVKAELARTARRHDLELCGEEVLFGDIVFLGEDLQDIGLDGLFLGEFLPGGSVVVGFARVLGDIGIEHERLAADEQIERLALDDLARILLHLLLRQVNEQVGDDEHGVGRIFAHCDGHDGPVGLGDDAVNGQRERDPLVLLDAAIVVRVEKRQVG